MNVEKYTPEKGQILVIFSILIVGFLAILALAIDGGFAYASRRAAQNAADAAALAGARYYCDGQPEVVWKQAIIDYAKLNHDATIDTVSLTNDLIYVKASVEHASFFGSLLGQDTIKATADAEAGCFIADTAIGALPIGWSCKAPAGGLAEYPQYGYDTDAGGCKIVFPKEPFDVDAYKASFNKSNPPGPDDKPIYLIMDEDDADSDFVCADPDDPDADPPPGQSFIDCDLDNDGENDVLAGGARSWLDLNGSGGGSNELADWMRNGFQQDLKVHWWVPAQNGVSNNVFHAARDYRVGSVVLIPVYDAFCDDEPSANCDGGGGGDDTYHDGDPGDDPGDVNDYVVPVNSGGVRRYHISGFVRFFITCVQVNPNHDIVGDCPGFAAFMDANDDVPGLTGAYSSSKAIEGFFVSGFMDGLYGKSSGGPDLQNYTIYLNK